MKKKLSFVVILFALFFGGNNSLSAQPWVTDSLLQELQNHPEADTNRVNILLSLSGSLYRGLPDSAKVYAKEALRLSEQLTFKKGTALAYQALARSFEIGTMSDSALFYMEQAKSLFGEMGDEDQVMMVNYEMSSVWAHTDRYEKSMQMYLKLLPYFELKHNEYMMGEIYSEIGFIYVRQRLFNEAIENLEKARALVESSDRKEGIVRILNILSKAYQGAGDFDRALNTIDRAIEISKERRGPLAPLLTTKGQLYLRENYYEAAEQVFMEALSRPRLEINLKDRILVHQMLASLYFQTHRLAEVKWQAQEGLELYRLTDTGSDVRVGLGRIALMTMLANAEKELGNTEEAFDLILEAKQLGDSLSRAETAKSISELQTKYETEKKEAQIELLKVENQVANLRILVLGIVALVVIIGIILGFWLYYRWKSEQKRIRLEAMKSELQKFGLVISEKNQFISSFKEELDEVRKHVKTLEGRKELTLLVDSIHQNMNLTEEEGELFTKINQLNAGFYAELRRQNDSLTENDERLATLIQMDLSTKDIANILHIEPGSVKRAKTRLKKKLNLDGETDLGVYLKGLAA